MTDELVIRNELMSVQKDKKSGFRGRLFSSRDKKETKTTRKKKDKDYSQGPSLLGDSDTTPRYSRFHLGPQQALSHSHGSGSQYIMSVPHGNQQSIVQSHSLDLGDLDFDGLDDDDDDLHLRNDDPSHQMCVFPMNSSTM